MPHTDRMKHTNTLFRLAAAVCLLAALPAWAGPPLICSNFQIGTAKSLPWKSTNGWNGVDSSYDTTRLIADTLALLAPSTPIKVRMETMRRAAIYSSRQQGLAGELTARLMARTLDAEAAGDRQPQAWFDAGYFVESLRQATFIYRYDMLSPAERKQWVLRGDKPGLDGYAWVRKAIQLGGKDMEPALRLMEGYREADLRSEARRP